jgi:ribosomal protein S18 acetylase RimI-like enzyme
LPWLHVIRYRHFRNCDPPGLAEVWRSQPPIHGRVQPLMPQWLEQHVFAKTYFDPAGLIVALGDDRVVGFAHAGFGASDDRASLDRETGVVCQLLVAPHAERETIARDLLASAEEYLRERGAKLIYGGGIFPASPFYLGLYGGSELPGVLASDAPMLAALAGYREIDRVVIFERELASFRVPVDRRVMQVRRNYRLEATFDPPALNWWEACTYGGADRTRFVLRPLRETQVAASATFWDMEPLASSWGMHAVGLVELTTLAPLRRQGLAMFLVGEALRQLHAHGVARCQVQAMASNAAALALYRKLGFVEIDQGIVLRKP